MDTALYKLMNKRLNELDRGLDYKAPIFGFYWDKQASPELIRTHDAVGMVANAGVDGQFVQNDFDSAPIWGQMGEVADDYGNVFIRIPKLYIRKTDGPDFMTMAVTTRPLPGFYRPWSFWDFERGRELQYLDYGKYKASLGAGNRLESKPNVYPLIDTHIVNMRNYARNNNVNGLRGYQQNDIHALDMLQALFFIEFATLDSQSIMAGWTNGRYSTDLTVISESQTNRVVLPNSNAANYQIGYPISVGTGQSSANRLYGREIVGIEDYDETNKSVYFDGDPIDIEAGWYVKNSGWKTGFSANIAASSGSIVDNTSGKYPCVYRGIESPFGDVTEFIDGVNINDNQAWVAKNADNYVSNVFAEPYEQLSYKNATGSSGYIREKGYDPGHPYAQLPTLLGGSSTTYYADQGYPSDGSVRILRAGGSFGSAASAGLSYLYWLTSSSASTVTGGRLLKKPL